MADIMLIGSGYPKSIIKLKIYSHFKKYKVFEKYILCLWFRPGQVVLGHIVSQVKVDKGCQKVSYFVGYFSSYY